MIRHRRSKTHIYCLRPCGAIRHSQSQHYRRTCWEMKAVANSKFSVLPMKESTSSSFRSCASVIELFCRGSKRAIAAHDRRDTITETAMHNIAEIISVFRISRSRVLSKRNPSGFIENSTDCKRSKWWDARTIEIAPLEKAYGSSIFTRIKPNAATAIAKAKPSPWYCAVLSAPTLAIATTLRQLGVVGRYAEAAGYPQRSSGCPLK